MATASDHMLYIQERVNPVLEQMVTQLLLERPEEPQQFMIKWLTEQKGGAPVDTGPQTVEGIQVNIIEIVMNFLNLVVLILSDKITCFKCLKICL